MAGLGGLLALIGSSAKKTNRIFRVAVYYIIFATLSGILQSMF